MSNNKEILSMIKEKKEDILYWNERLEYTTSLISKGELYHIPRVKELTEKITRAYLELQIMEDILETRK